MVARVAVVLAVLVAAGCADEEQECQGGPQYVLEAGGRLSLYHGCDVGREVSEHGSFEPDLVDDFTVVEIPTKLVPTADDPTTVSLCDPDREIRVEFHDSECTIAPSRYNPILTMRDDGACIVHGESGQPGVSGMVQIRWEAGTLRADVAFRADLYFPTDSGGYEGLGYSRGGIPVDLKDPDLEDPLVRETCPCSDPDVCEPPEGF